MIIFMPSTSEDKIISGSAAGKLIRSHDGDCALLYLWYLLNGQCDHEKAAGDLCMTLSQIRDADEKLGRMGLPVFSSPEKSSARRTGHISAPVYAPPDDTVPPDYSSEEISSAAQSDPDFAVVRDRLQEILGRTPARNDLSSLLSIYRHLGLPAEVIYVLFQYCLDISHSMNGSERPPTMRYIERTAYTWANEGIHTAEEAEAYVEKRKALFSDIGKIKLVLEIHDRKLTTTEKNFITSWLEMGYTEEAVRIAYERTLDNTGKLAMPYLNRIILQWNEKGLHTPEEIEKNDPAEGPRKRSSSHSGKLTASRKGADSEFDPDEINRISITKG